MVSGLSQSRLRQVGSHIGGRTQEEQRTITQSCEMLLYEGIEAYKKEGPKFMQRLIAKQKLRTK